MFVPSRHNQDRRKQRCSSKYINKSARAWISSMSNSLECKDIASIIVTFSYRVHCLSWIVISNVQSSTVNWLFLRTPSSSWFGQFQVQSFSPSFWLFVFGAQKIFIVGPWDKCRCFTNIPYDSIQMACINVL